MHIYVHIIYRKQSLIINSTSNRIVKQKPKEEEQHHNGPKAFVSTFSYVPTHMSLFIDAFQATMKTVAA